MTAGTALVLRPGSGIRPENARGDAAERLRICVAGYGKNLLKEASKESVDAALRHCAF